MGFDSHLKYVSVLLTVHLYLGTALNGHLRIYAQVSGMVLKPLSSDAYRRK